MTYVLLILDITACRANGSTSL